MRIVVAPDKFRGSLSADEAAAAIARGLAVAYPDAEVETIPIADGGEGTMQLIADALGGEVKELQVSGPLGDPVVAAYSVAGRRAVLEMSAASGLALVPEGTRDPWAASTCGTGELVAACLADGTQEIIIGIGGSATNDGGRGMAEALGYGFHGKPDGLLEMIEPPEIRPAERAHFTVACDVANPLLGEEGCTRVYGPQKGIQPKDFARHEARLERLAEVVRRDVAPEASPDAPGAGAAGGLGFGLMAFCGASLRPGFEVVAELTGLAGAIASADLVITGEGSMDAQTLMGKGPAGVADLAAGKRVVGFCGIARDRQSLEERFEAVYSLEEVADGEQDSIANAAALLERLVAERLG